MRHGGRGGHGGRVRHVRRGGHEGRGAYGR